VPSSVSDVAAKTVDFMTGGAASDIACNGLTWKNGLTGGASIAMTFVPGGRIGELGEQLAAKAGHDAEQQALKDIVDEASNGGRKALSRDDAETVLDWADEYNYPGRRSNPTDVTGDHPRSPVWNGQPHIHIPGAGRNGHVPVEPGVNPRTVSRGR
jgi:hypothetical protein